MKQRPVNSFQKTIQWPDFRFNRDSFSRKAQQKWNTQNALCGLKSKAKPNSLNGQTPSGLYQKMWGFS